MATLTPQVLNQGAGVIPTYAACTGGGDAAPCSRNTFLHIKNGSGGSITVTLAIPASASGFTGAVYGSLAVVLAAGVERMTRNLDPQLFQDPTTGLCTITYSGVTSLTIACINVPEA